MPDPAGVVQLCNIALARIGSTQVITSLDPVSDSSNEAAQCAIFYSFCRDELLRKFPWPWASTYATLAQVNLDGVAANAEWQYSYRYPPDCLFAVRLISTPGGNTTVPPQTTGPLIAAPSPYFPDRSDTNPYPNPFSMGQDDDGPLILCDIVNPTLKYTTALTDPTRFPADFTDALAWRLAMELAYGLAISDNRREFANKKFDLVWPGVMARAYNESQNDQPFVDFNSEFIRSRYNQGYSGYV